MRMRQVKDVFINDSVEAIWYRNDKEKIKIIKDLEMKRRRGVDVKNIETDEKRSCIIYTYRNTHKFH